MEKRSGCVRCGGCSKVDPTPRRGASENRRNRSPRQLAIKVLRPVASDRSTQNGPGTAHSALALTNSPSLLGAAFYQQTSPLEFDATGALLAVRGSNALAATIGTL